MKDFEIAALADRFARATVAAAEWTHKAHVLVAVHALRRTGWEAAAALFRDALPRYLQSRNLPPDAYSETMTLGWLTLIGAAMGRLDCGQALDELAAAVFADVGGKEALQRHYSAEALAQAASRHTAIAPDRAPLPDPLQTCLRPATRFDLPAISAIYDYYVEHSTCTFALQPKTSAEHAAWLARHSGPYKVIVATRAGYVVGWGALSPFHSREGFARTVENSIYVRSDFHRSGLGTALLGQLIFAAEQAGHHAIVAAISADQEASLALHRACGFVERGRLPEVGWKFGRWLDVVYMQRLL